MDRELVYKFPEDIKEIYLKYFPEDKSVTYGNLREKIDEAIENGGIEITDIMLNADGKYTITDADENEHTLTVTETDGQITAIMYDDNNVPLSFSSGELTGVGDTDINIDRYPNPEIGNIGYYVKFKVDGDDYYIVSCQQGESITEPPAPVTSKSFNGWKDSNNNLIAFPYTPDSDIEIIAILTEYDFGTAISTSINGNQYAANHTSTNYSASRLCIVGFDSSGSAYAVFTEQVSDCMVWSRYTSSDHYRTSATNEILYNGTTYYYAKSAYGAEASSRGSVRYKISSTGTDNEKVIELLNAYFGITE